MKLVNKLLYLNGISFVHNTNLYCMNDKGKITNLRQQKNTGNRKYNIVNSKWKYNNTMNSICLNEFPGYGDMMRERRQIEKMTECLDYNYQKALGEICNNNGKDNGNEIKSKGHVCKVSSDYILKKIFAHLFPTRKLNIIKYNKKLQKKLQINIDTYRKYTNGYTICAYFENEKEIDLKLLNKDTQAYTIESEDVKIEGNDGDNITNSNYVVMCHVDDLDVESFNNTFKNAKFINIITQDNLKELIKEEELNNLKKKYKEGKNKIK